MIIETLKKSFKITKEKIDTIKYLYNTTIIAENEEEVKKIIENELKYQENCQVRCSDDYSPSTLISRKETITIKEE